MNGERLTSGSSVSFRLKDAICPEFGRIARQLNPEVTVCGEVAFFSDSGGECDHFAIIAVDGIDAPLVVPVAKVHPFASVSTRSVGRSNRDGRSRPFDVDGPVVDESTN